MATKQFIEERLTSRYVDSCSHLDQWGQSFEIKVLGDKLLDEGNGYDVGPTTRFRVIGPKGADQKVLQRTISQNMSYGGCSHEHDCCGCWSASASVTKVRKGVFSVLLSTSRNY
jgi:hypothetical protein